MSKLGRITDNQASECARIYLQKFINGKPIYLILIKEAVRMYHIDKGIENDIIIVSYTKMLSDQTNLNWFQRMFSATEGYFKIQSKNGRRYYQAGERYTGASSGLIIVDGNLKEARKYINKI